MIQGFDTSRSRQSPLEELQNGAAFRGYRTKNKEETNRKYLIGWAT